ncbi:MAG: radical SAM domain-containing protein [Proteobacteria bacterium]|nr:radical SAM domain-containing protein [Pseudomonadota bacterium]
MPGVATTHPTPIFATLMNASFLTKNCQIVLEKKGGSNYSKLSFPLHCGVFSEISSASAVLHFNLSGEIIRAKGKGNEWGHPHEWLKRTKGDDWVYYSTGGYAGVFESIGEYYLPNFEYPTNNLLGGHPFSEKAISGLKSSWHQTLTQLAENITDTPEPVHRFLVNALSNSPACLAKKAQRLQEIIGGRISVLPPDARHVDYNLIPLTISQGCLHKCRFCKVKNTLPFRVKTAMEITYQIGCLKNFYGADLPNYNALFLGEHDSLMAGSDLICFGIEEAYREFGFADSHIAEHKTFLFGSATSLVNAPEHLFTNLEKLPGMHYINIGLESADQDTLDKLGKPISVGLVQEAFTRMQEINDRYGSIEITANFIMDVGLPANHYPAIMELIRERLVRTKPKGSIYFSPLTFNQPSRARLFEFNRLKILSRLPTFLYIIQRL